MKKNQKHSENKKENSADLITLQQGLNEHLKRLGTTKASYMDRLFWIKIASFSIPLLNFKARQRAVQFHDLHHVLTGYKTDFKGEAEISAWEMASGLGKHPIAALYALLAIPTGILISPRSVFKAFLRGKQSRNLYQEKELHSWMNQKVQEARKKLKIDKKVSREGSLKDYFEFIGWCVAGFATLTLTGGIWFLPWIVGNSSGS